MLDKLSSLNRFPCLCLFPGKRTVVQLSLIGHWDEVETSLTPNPGLKFRFHVWKNCDVYHLNLQTMTLLIFESSHLAKCKYKLVPWVFKNYAKGLLSVLECDVQQYTFQVSEWYHFRYILWIPLFHFCEQRTYFLQFLKNHESVFFLSCGKWMRNQLKYAKNTNEIF